jgi:hypothetical protein
VEGNKCRRLWTKWYNIWIIMYLLINSPSSVFEIICIFRWLYFDFSFLIRKFFFFFLVSCGGGETESIWYISHYQAYCTSLNDRWWVWNNGWNENWQGNLKYLDKTCPSATLSTTYPTWPDLGSISGCRGGKPATNSLNYGAAFWLWVTSMYFVLAVFIC